MPMAATGQNSIIRDLQYGLSLKFEVRLRASSCYQYSRILENCQWINYWLGSQTGLDVGMEWGVATESFPSSEASKSSGTSFALMPRSANLQFKKCLAQPSKAQAQAKPFHSQQRYTHTHTETDRRTDRQTDKTQTGTQTQTPTDVRPSVCVSLCLCVCPSLRPSVSRSVCPYVC